MVARSDNVAKHDDEKPEKTEIVEKEIKQEAAKPSVASKIPVAAAANGKDTIESRLESQRKMQIVLAVLLGVMFVWLAFISARMYENHSNFNERGFMMNQGQPWGSDNSSGSSMMNGSGSSNSYQYR